MDNAVPLLLSTAKTPKWWRYEHCLLLLVSSFGARIGRVVLRSFHLYTHLPNLKQNSAVNHVSDHLRGKEFEVYFDFLFLSNQDTLVLLVGNTHVFYSSIWLITHKTTVVKAESHNSTISFIAGNYSARMHDRFLHTGSAPHHVLPGSLTAPEPTVALSCVCSIGDH